VSHDDEADGLDVIADLFEAAEALDFGLEDGGHPDENSNDEVGDEIPPPSSYPDDPGATGPQPTVRKWPLEPYPYGPRAYDARPEIPRALGDDGKRRRHWLDRGRPGVDDRGRPLGPDRGLWPVVHFYRLRYCARLDQSDSDNAMRFLKHRGRDVCIRIQVGGRAPIWVSWTGTHWDDVTGAHGVKAIAQTIGEEIKREASFLLPTSEELSLIETAQQLSAIPAADRDLDAWRIILAGAKVLTEGNKRAKARKDFGASCKNDGRINAMLACLAPHVLLPPARFNADKLKVATQTQTISWSRELEHFEGPGKAYYSVRMNVRKGHDRRDYITTLLPFDYDPDATCPRWIANMDRFQPDSATRKFCQISAGLGLLGLTEQALIFHYGDGANFKSVFLEVISRVLGPLAGSLPAEAVAGDDTGGVKASPEIAGLYGKRFVRVTELKEGVPLQEAFVKRITGSEAFPARNLFEGYFEFYPLFITHTSANGKPKISGTDNGIWRRMRVVKWPVTLSFDEQRQFDDVVGELMEEAPGILRWLVDGALMYLADGLVSPPGVMAETQSYRDEMDSVGRFIRACVTITHDPEDAVTGKPFFDAYTAWAVESALRPVNITRFGRDMGKVEGIIKDEKRIVTYRCVILHDVPRNPSDSADRRYADPHGW